jgi:hypothetical protein
MPESEQRRFQYQHESSKTVSRKRIVVSGRSSNTSSQNACKTDNELYNLNPFEVYKSHFTSTELNG